MIPSPCRIFIAISMMNVDGIGDNSMDSSKNYETLHFPIYYDSIIDLAAYDS